MAALSLPTLGLTNFCASDRGYSVREQLPLPTKPPFTVHLGNMSFDATQGDIMDFFSGCDVTSVRIVEDKMEMKPKGFGYAEFSSLDGLKKALEFNGTQFQGRNIRVSVAEPREYQPYASFSQTPSSLMLVQLQKKKDLMVEISATGIGKAPWQTQVVHPAVCPIEADLALDVVVEASTMPLRLAVSAVAVAATNQATEKCETLATGIERGH